MKPSEVREEWVEIAAAVLYDRHASSMGYEHVRFVDVARSPANVHLGKWRDSARHALAAVLPLAVAEERAECAKVARGTPYHGRYRTWPWWANPDGSQGNRENESDVVRHADAIAAAIRSRGEPR